MRRLFILLAFIFSYKANAQSTDCLNAEIAVEGDIQTPYAPYWFTYEASEDSYVTISSYGKSEIPTTLRVYSDCNFNSVETKINTFNISQDDVSFPLSKGESVKLKWEAYDSNEAFDWELISEPVQYVLESDSLALVDLYNSTTGDSWFRNAYWLEGNVQSWQGITVENNRVTEIYLERNNLNGSVQSSLGDLSELKILNLARNEKLSGVLPSELGDFSMLEELALQDCNFSGAVPNELSNLTKLTNLRLSSNKFHSLPDLSHFNFERLILHNNYFDFADLEPYRYIYNNLHNYNNLQGITGDRSSDIEAGSNYTLTYEPGGSENVYQWFKNNEAIEGANSNSYQILDASLDDIGTYRLEVTSPLMDVKLISRENQITVDGYKFGDICSLADSLSPGRHEMDEEKFWYLINNDYNYDLVATADAHSSEYLDSKFTVFDACEGNIVAENDGHRDSKAALVSFIIPAGESYYLLLENFGEIGDLDFQYNTEKLEYVSEQDSLALVDFYNATFGESWDFKDNWLQMPVAAWLGVKVVNGRVNAIDLPFNHLTGSLNASLGNLSELKTLKVHNNSISGSIPPEIEGLLQLKHLELHNNNLEGAIPQEMEKLWRLYNVNLANNNLSDIEADLTELSYSYFNIKGNRFEFDDLELNRNRFTDYNEMQLFGDMKSIGISLGEDIVLSANTGGTRNNYQWYLDGEELQGATDETLHLENITSDQLGRYTVKVKNTYLFRLVLEREPIILYESGLEQGDDCSNPMQVEWYNISNFNPTWYSYSAHADSYLLLESECCDNTRIEVYDACGGNLIASSNTAENGDEFASLRFEAKQGKDYYFLWMNEDERQVHWYMEEFPSVSVLEADSLALVDLFRATQGQQWFSQSETSQHWLEGPVSTWYGISLTGNRVTGINLYNNLLKGQLPESFGDLTALEVLQLQGYSNYLVGDLPQSFSKLADLTVFAITGNHFTGSLSSLESLNQLRTIDIIDNDFTELLDASALSNLNTFNISGNRLEFDDMESVVDKLDKNEYQQKFGTAQQIEANIGEDRTIDFQVGGTNNSYQWQKNGEDIEGATNDYLILSDILPEDSGSYQLLVENQVVPGLTLKSKIIQIKVLGSGKIDQDISFDPLPNKTFGDAAFKLDATASSGLEVSYQSSDPAIASIIGDEININGAGSVMIMATQDGDDNYYSATPVQQELIINKADQEIQFDSLSSKTYGDSTFILNANASSDLSVNYESSDTTLAFINANEVTIRGTGSVLITAFQNGDENFNPADVVVRELQIEKADQVLTIEPISDQEIIIDSVQIVANVNSALPLKYRLEGPANIVGATIVLNGELGLIKLFVEQAGNSNYNEVKDSISFNVVDNRLIQEISFDPIENKSTDSEPFTIEAISTSELPLNFSVLNGPAIINENTVSLKGELGLVEIQIMQEGNSEYKPADTILSFEVVKLCELFDATFAETKMVSCYGESNGSLKVVVEGGKPPYSYSWSHGGDSAIAENLQSGFYEVTISDESNCSVTIGTRIHQPNPIQVKADIISSTGAEGNGSISLDVKEGNPPYTFLWNTGEEDSVIENLAPSIYEVFITDSEGCTNQKTYSVGGITAIDSKVEEGFYLKVYPNPVEDIVTVSSSNICSITLFDAFGKLIRKEEISSGAFKLNLDNLESGVYFLKGDKGEYHRIVKK
ncbi:T9SS type A sorting domain-containing protein [Marivirga tractuosa]|uniref:T9SS type A sorting domain-containing protein n=1 Tax=Marivirga tractuosa TaxID=1006 RepID=UPI0035CF23EC